jgi:hypothetical protein
MQPLVINFKNQKNSTALSFLSAKINEMGTFTIEYKVEIKLALIFWTGYTLLMDDSIQFDLKELDQTSQIDLKTSMEHIIN